MLALVAAAGLWSMAPAQAQPAGAAPEPGADAENPPRQADAAPTDPAANAENPAGEVDAAPTEPAADAPRRREPPIAAMIILAEGSTANPIRERTFRTYIERAARSRGLDPQSDLAQWVRQRNDRAGSVRPGRLAAIIDASAEIVEARHALANLREDDALRRLSRAARIIEAHADVPGSAAWLAEAYTALGVAAAQAGMDGLMEASLARAATFDHRRGVRAAEAPPHVLAQAESIARAVATRPTGEIAIGATATDARVFLDDVRLGALPMTVRAPVGYHVLRIEAPGYLAWGRVMHVHEGRRPALQVALSPDPAREVVDRLLEAAERREFAAVCRHSRTLATLGDPLGAVWLVEIGAGSEARALVTACSATGCAPTRRLRMDEVPFVVPADGYVAPEPVTRALTADRNWLYDATSVPPPPPPVTLIERWYFWAGVGLVAVLAGAATYQLTRPEPAQQFRVVVDFGELGNDN